MLGSTVPPAFPGTSATWAVTKMTNELFGRPSGVAVTGPNVNVTFPVAELTAGAGTVPLKSLARSPPPAATVVATVSETNVRPAGSRSVTTSPFVVPSATVAKRA